MAEFQVYYSITLQGQYRIEAATEDDACDALRALADADLVAECEFGNGDISIDGVEDVTEPHALEQLAEQAE